ncbi:GNAT family N-acetyltransferase [Thalassotalea euphylliae]|uniref:GNAT family N-acetyltransferase n=1 Tax=Thalassotalea euphylliae TaxID=1655234 RepID=A0A3E0TML8_9GAMM|nr:bifunctional GNAT family N-acetyltransferase/hotdog fold thioesterase [Thalassotalea euphylliae]REL25285.1 GNAT family N-acetyltransferase [Thalassotalea euphylliae]
MYVVKAPENKADFKRYYLFRWQILRAPWHQALGSEQDDLEGQSIHRFIENNAGEIVAVGRLHKTSQYQAQIRYMAVATDQQGLGLGKKIVDALETQAIRHGVTEIQLNARENALAFYRKLGYRQVEKSHLLYGEIQHYLMVKSLRAGAEHSETLSQTLVNTWHQTIPMSSAMQLQVSYYNGRQLFTSCDLSFNKNLHNTMFAGSIYTQATLTGWGWVYMKLSEQQLSGDIVLADATIRYLAPVGGAGVGFTQAEMISGELTALEHQQRAKVSVDVHVLSGDKVAAIFSGKYVVSRT